MRVQLSDWLVQGSPTPLRWGDALAAVVADQGHVTAADDAAAELSKVYLTQAAATPAKTNSPDPE